MGLVRSVDDFVSAKCACLSESLSADFTNEGPGACVNRHMSREVVVSIEGLGELRNPVVAEAPH